MIMRAMCAVRCVPRVLEGGVPTFMPFIKLEVCLLDTSHTKGEFDTTS